MDLLENQANGGALFFSTARERELLHRVFTEKRAGIYAGVDPTAPSLHVGHMLPFMVLAWGYVWGLPVHFIVSHTHAPLPPGETVWLTSRTAWRFNKPHR